MIRLVVLAASLLTPAAPIAKPSWWFPGEGSGWIDFTPRESGHIIIRVTINGEPAWALVDTGFDTMTLSKRFAQAHHLMLTPAPGRVPTSFGGTTPFYIVSGVGMAIGDVRTKAPSTFQVVDLDSVSSRFGMSIDAVVGLDMFRVAGMEVDEDHHRLRLIASGRIVLPPHGTVRLGPQGSLMVTDIAIGPDPSAVAVVDTGSDDDLMLTPDAAQRDGVRTITEIASRGAGGSFVDELGFAKTVTLGSQRIDRAPTKVSRELTPVMGDGIGALIGMGLLRRYNFAIDLSAHAFWLRPRSPPAPSELKSTSGIQGDVAVGRGRIEHVMKTRRPRRPDSSRATRSAPLTAGRLGQAGAAPFPVPAIRSCCATGESTTW